MHQAFGFIPEALDNTQKIADMCEISFETGGILIPTFELPEDDQAIYERALDLEKEMYVTPPLTTPLQEEDSTEPSSSLQGRGA